jgi:aspartate/methionine/tyrosine aminotransferase
MGDSMPGTGHVAARTADLSSFKVMDILEEAQALEAQGREIIHLEIGEPDFPTPECIVAAGERALRRGETRYTHSLGLLELREAIAGDYHRRYGVTVSPERIVVTSGTSPAMLLVFSALCEPGDEVILPDPHYACYPNFLLYLGTVPKYFTISEDEGYQYELARVEEALSARTAAVIVNSPANPTGAVLRPELLAELAELGPYVISDEIYHGLVYGDAEARSILEFTERAFVLNGFSKRYAMTGWRLGYAIVPPALVDAIQVMQQNFFICAADFVQRAGIAAIESAEADVEGMRREYARRRDVMLQRLGEIGLSVRYEPQGAFYVLVNVQGIAGDSLALARKLLHEAGVAVTPGIDFGSKAEGHLRFSYASSVENIEEGIRRLAAYVAG